ncbi:MAG: hypothetical protein AAF646_02410 [Pseudomonadota bacterium]
MFDSVDASLEVVTQVHPLQTRGQFDYVAPGNTIADIIAVLDLDPANGIPEVLLIRNGHIWPVPLDMWRKVTPKVGTRIEIRYPVEGPALIGLAASAAISAAGAAIAGAFATGALGYSLIVAGVSIVGGLLLNAIIPPVEPPDRPGAPDPSFTITGARNQENRYGVFPKVCGRHRIFPVKTATGRTEIVDAAEVYFYARMAFGWGPLALEDLRIGTTPIWQFSDVEIEFLNVDQAETVSRAPQLAPLVRAWRQGSETLELYPDNIAQDPETVLLEDQVDVIRETRVNTVRASVDITWPGGIGAIQPEGDIRFREVDVDFAYRLAGSADPWTTLPRLNERARSRDVIRRTYEIEFPSADQWEIRVTLDRKPADEEEFFDTFISAIRSIRPGTLPSNPNIAEVAIRIRASEQLQGQIDTLSGIAVQMTPVWTGSAWTTPQPIRHPAWVYLDMLRGNHLRRPVADTKILLDEFTAWADEEPHWTCDYVFDTETPLSQGLSLIAATGRARPGLPDLRYSIIRDGGAGPVRQIFTPRNSFDFRGSVTFPREIHGLRVRARSEDLDWEFDEISVYAPGFNASNAGELERLDIPGIVIPAGAGDEGNVYRLGQYWLRSAILRPERFEWRADFEHIRVTRGDKARIVSDVALIGVGAARIADINGPLVTLDESAGSFGVNGAHRLTARRADGTLEVWTASTTDGGATWEGGFPSAEIGDLVIIEKTTQASQDVLITDIFPESNETARLVGVPAAPEVLDVDSDVIPPYVPIITAPVRERDVRDIEGPLKPVPASLRSDASTVLRGFGGLILPRIVLSLQPFAERGEAPAFLQLRWRELGAGAIWTYGETQVGTAMTLYTGGLQDALTYEAEVRSIGTNGQSQGWVAAGSEIAFAPEDAPRIGEIATRAEALEEAFGDLLGNDFPFEEVEIADVVKAANEVITNAVQVNTAAIEETAVEVRDDVDQTVSNVLTLTANVDQVVNDLTGVNGELLTLETRLIDIENFDLDGSSVLFQRVTGIEADIVDLGGGLSIAENNITIAEGTILDIINFDISPTSGLAQRITFVETSLGNDISAVSTAVQSKVNEAEAVAAVEDEISASFNNLTALASATSIAKATRDQLLSGHIWRVDGGSMELVSVAGVDANGVAGAPRVTAKIDADYLQITGIAQIAQAVIEDLAVENAFISNLVVDTLNLAEGAVTIPRFAIGGVLQGNGGFQVAASDTLTFTRGGNSVLILWSFEQGYNGVQDWGFRIRVNGVLFQQRSGLAFGNDYPSGQWLLEFVPSGQRTINLEWFGENANISALGSLVAIGVQA